MINGLVRNKEIEFVCNLLPGAQIKCSFSIYIAGPYLAGGQGGQLPPLGKLNVDFFNEVFVFDGIFLVAILVQNLKKTG